MNEWFPSSKLLWLGASVLLVFFQVKDVFSDMAPLVMAIIDAHASPCCPLVLLP